MDHKQFSELYMCTFKSDARVESLRKAWEHYFSVTENMNNVDARREYLNLKQWAISNGFSHSEIHSIKVDVLGRIKFSGERGVR